MAVMVKDVMGVEKEVASKGVAIAGLTTGIIGSALGVLNSGLLGGLGNGIGGNVNATTANLIAEGAACCFVNKDMFYGTLINQINTQADRDIAIERRFAGVESAIATNAAVGACNHAAIEREFQVVADRFAVENIINDKNLQIALCGTIKGTNVVTPSQIGSTYVNPVNVLDQHEARIYDASRFGPCTPYTPYAPCTPCGGHF